MSTTDIGCICSYTYTVYHLPSTEWTIADVHSMSELITAGHMKRSTCVNSICIEYIVFVFVRI